MSLAKDFSNFLLSSLGLARDLTVDAARTYERFLWRILKYQLAVIAFGILLAVTGVFLPKPGLLATGIFVIGLTSVSIIILWLLVIEVAFVISPLFKRSLKVAGFVAGWTLFLFLVAYSSPPDSNLFNRVIIAVGLTLPAYFLFGQESTSRILVFKIVFLVAILAFGVALPRTKLMVTKTVQLLDITLSKFLDSGFKELDLTLSTLNSVQMFASDGKPLYWCRIDQESPAGYRCYDRDGGDPYSQQELRPISPKILNDIRSRLKARTFPAPHSLNGPRVAGAPESMVLDTRTEKHGTGASPKPTLSAAQESAADFISPLAKHKNSPSDSPRWTVVAWSVGEGGPMPNGRILHEIRSAGSEIGLKHYGQSLRDKFVTNGVSRRVLQGDYSVLVDANLVHYTDYLVLAEFSTRRHLDTEAKPLQSVTNELQFLIVRLSDMHSSELMRATEVGLGAGFRDAEDEAYQRLMLFAKPKLDSLLKGFVQ